MYARHGPQALLRGLPLMATALEYWFGRRTSSSARKAGPMTPTQRRYLEDAVRCQGGELRWSVRSGGAEGAIHRMVKMLVAAELVAFDPRRMAWIVTRAGRAAVKEGPPGAVGN
jgi:hypothetical protein